MQIPIHLDDQHKITFTFPNGTFAYIRMPFGLYNTPASIQHCMMVVFSEFIKEIIEVVRDDFSVYEKLLWISWQTWTRFSQGCGGRFSAKLGKIPLYGKARYSVGTRYIRKRD
jgi:hypothetical protein